MRSIILIFPTLLILLLLSACQDRVDLSPVPPPETISPWEAVSGFENSKKITLGTASSDKGLLVLTPQTVSAITKDHSVFHLNHPAPLAHVVMPITKDFFPYFDDRKRSMILFTSHRPTNDLARLTIPYDSLGADIVGLPSFLWRNLMAANDARQMIIPLTNSSGELMLFHFQVEMEEALGNGEEWVKEARFQKLPLPGLSGIGFIQGMGDGFLLSYHQNGQNRTARVANDGTLTPLLDDMLSRGVFPIGDNWYGWNEKDQSLYQSTDNGQSWQALNMTIYDTPLHDLIGQFGYCQVENRTIVYDPYRIYEVERSESGAFKLTILDSKGLEGNLLTSVQPWEGKVYACTLSGVFSRSVQEFFTPLQVE